VRGAAVRGAAVRGAVVLLLFAVAVNTQEPAARGLTAPDEISRAYGVIFDARFTDLPALLARTCPPAPREACLLLDAVSAWWQIQLDPYSRARDGVFQSRIETAIDAVRSWTIREPMRAEAWFYLGAAYGARVKFKVLRGGRLEAARDGTRIKDALERALVLDPAMGDAYFGIGLYHYYAAVAPPAARMLRWLLLLPGGDRAGGLAEMERARAEGVLVRDEADYQLHSIHVWYEKEYRRALEYLTGLSARHPRNPHFRQAAAEILDFYIDDTPASLEAWQSLLEAAGKGEVEAPEMAETSARLGVASQLDQLGQSEAAIEHLRAVIAARPVTPYRAFARAQLQLGDALEHLGRRAEAAAAYRAAISAAGSDDPQRIASRARASLRAQR
jgi:tetratricopeptide (TPR) repeat protein